MCDFCNINWCELKDRPCDFRPGSCPFLEEYENTKKKPTAACDYTYLQDAERRKVNND